MTKTMAKTMAAAAVSLTMLGGTAFAGEPLPELGSLDARSDYARFMQPDVPHAVRAAALARLWVLDPAIRDAPGTARDGDWDWHAGVPGCGPAPGPEEVRATLGLLHQRLDAAETGGAAVFAGAADRAGRGG